MKDNEFSLTNSDNKENVINIVAKNLQIVTLKLETLSFLLTVVTHKTVMKVA